MRTESVGSILAIITLHKDRVISSGPPVFHARDQAGLDSIAMRLSKITLGVVHEIESGVYAIVKH